MALWRFPLHCPEVRGVNFNPLRTWKLWRSSVDPVLGQRRERWSSNTGWIRIDWADRDGHPPPRHLRWSRPSPPALALPCTPVLTPPGTPRYRGGPRTLYRGAGGGGGAGVRLTGRGSGARRHGIHDKGHDGNTRRRRPQTRADLIGFSAWWLHSTRGASYSARTGGSLRGRIVGPTVAQCRSDVYDVDPASCHRWPAVSHQQETTGANVSPASIEEMRLGTSLSNRCYPAVGSNCAATMWCQEIY